MGSLENPLVHCHTIRDLLNRINRIHSELIDHENTRPKCEICWQNHAEFDLLKSKLQLLVQDVSAKEEQVQPIFEYVQLDGGLQSQQFTSVVVKEEPEVLLSEASEDMFSGPDDDYSPWESSSERCEMVAETDALKKERKRNKVACKFCFKTFYQGNSLKEHLAKHTGDKPFKCKVCSEAFKSFHQYTAHRKSHMRSSARLSLVKLEEEELNIKDETDEIDQKPFECAFCGNEFDRKKQIALHMRSHINPRRPRRNAQKSQGPKKVQRIEMKYTKPKCTVCRKKFPTERGLQIHMTVMNHGSLEKPLPTGEETPYPCDVCKKYFRNAITLETHKKFRDSAKLHCDTCNKSYCRYTDFYNHQRKIHKINTSFQCAYCTEHFTNFRLIYKHHKMRHPREAAPASPFLCEMCGISMMDSRDLNRHVMQIHESKRHKCDQCSRTFRTDEEVEEHRRVHIPISQIQDLYACDKCPKKFRLKLTLQKHLKQHEAGLVAEMFCHVCGKRFTSPDMLEAHKVKHENEEPRPHGCDLCGRTFKVLKYLNQHRKNNHNIFTDMMLNPKIKKK